MRNDKEDTILRSDAIEAVYRAYRRPSDDEVFIRMREELERVPGTSMATIQANVEVDMDELVKRVTEEIRYSFILDPVKRGKWIDKGWKGDWQFETDGRGNCWYEYECSECGFHNHGTKSKYCPNCGCRMKGADDE